MVTEIEQAASELITNKLSSIRKSGAKKAGEIVGPSPSIDTACLEGSFKRLSKGTWKQEVVLSLLITLANPKSEEVRRRNINPLIQAIVQLLLGQDLGLDIKALEPLSWREVTNEDDYQEGKIRFLIKYKTSFDIEKQDDEVVDDLLTIGLNYYLQDPADATADASDTVNLVQ